MYENFEIVRECEQSLQGEVFAGKKKCVKLAQVDSALPPIPVSELRKWDLFRDLDLDYLKDVRLAFVFGSKNIWLTTTVTGILVTTNDIVYAVGSNADGALGVDSDVLDFVSIPLKVEALCGKKIIRIYAGGEEETECFYIALTEDGRVYVWGCNTDGQLGLGHQLKVFTPTFLNSLAEQKVINIACGAYHSIALTSEGQVYTWGGNMSGQGGIGSIEEFNFVPQMVQALIHCKIVSIAAGYYHSCALTQSGELRVWGCNEEGQLGMNPIEAQKATAPVEIPLLKFTKVVSGAFHVLALTAEGKMHCWGSNSFQELGLDLKTTFEFSPQEHDFGPIEDIEIKDFISVCRTKRGNCFVWGTVIKDCKEDRCVISKPQKVNFTSFLEVFRFYCHGQLMNEPLTDANTPRTPLTQFEIELVQQGDGSTSTDVLFLVEDRKIYAHKIMLELNSAYFATLFSERWDNYQDNVYKIGKEIRYDPFFSLIYSVYTNDIILTPGPTKVNDLLDLFLLADCFLFPNLHLKCQDMLKELITAENVVDMYDLTTNAPKMQPIQDAAFKFMIKNLNLIRKTLDNPKHEDLLKVLMLATN